MWNCVCLLWTIFRNKGILADVLRIRYFRKTYKHSPYIKADTCE